METTKELYERAKGHAGIRTDYEFAKKFGLTKQVVSKWTNGRSTFDDDNAELIASILEVDEAYVIACAHAERAKGEHAKGRWARIAALVVASSIPPAAGAFESTTTLGVIADNVPTQCVLCLMIRRFFERLIGVNNRYQFA